MLSNYTVDKPRKSGRRISVSVVGLLLLLGAGIYVYSYMKIHRAGSSASQAVTFSVPKGATTREVGQSLDDQELISGYRLFVLYASFTGQSGKIQAGDYALDLQMSMKEILATLASGKVTRNQKKAVMVEGWNNDQVRAKLVELGLVSEGQFNSALNASYDFKFSGDAKNHDYLGYLFPDTYQVNASLDAEGIIQLMLANFESRVTDKMLADMAAKGLAMHEVVTLASIIEREVGRNGDIAITNAVRAEMQRERQVVASVFYNRLEIGMPLQSDATVNFATGKADRRALLSDLEVDSPYNTYKNTGLPPGAISNPGVGSIMAAIYPADSDFLYFLHDPAGVAYFGRNLAEHNSNRGKYLD